MAGLVAAFRRDGEPWTPQQVKLVVASSAQRALGGVRWTSPLPSVLLVQCDLPDSPPPAPGSSVECDALGQIWVVKRGHLDNRAELAERLSTSLRGRRPLTHDSALLLAAYEVWGESFAEHVSGAYATAIWDNRQRKLIVARDHLGVTPLLVHDSASRYVAASEMSQLRPLLDGVGPVDEMALADYLTGQCVSRRRTFLRDVERLVPAGRSVVTDAGTRTNRYWSPSVPEDRPIHGIDEAAEHIRAEFLGAVRSASDVPGTVGCHLSGGLDSSAIFGAMALGAAGASARRFIGLSVLYPGLECDESKYIADVLRGFPAVWQGFLGTASTREPSAIAPPLLPESEMTAFLGTAGVRAVLTGHGGDELFAGSPIPLTWAMLPSCQRVRHLWWNSARSVATLGWRVRRELVRPAIPSWMMREYLRIRRRQHFSMLSPRALELASAVRDEEEQGLTQVEVYTQDRFWVPERRSGNDRADFITLRHGYEHRYPYRSLALVNSVAGLPLSAYRWAGEWRALQKRALGPFYSPMVGGRLDKADHAPARLRDSEELELDLGPLAEIGLLVPNTDDPRFTDAPEREPCFEVVHWLAALSDDRLTLV